MYCTYDLQEQACITDIISLLILLPLHKSNFTMDVLFVVSNGEAVVQHHRYWPELLKRGSMYYLEQYSLEHLLQLHQPSTAVPYLSYTKWSLLPI